MLNISKNNLENYIEVDKYASIRGAESRLSGKVLIRLSMFFLGITFVILFLPWTQNIRARGNVIALKPDQRPQMIHSIIAGRVEKWYVNEGDFVKKGDTILFISEIKDSYFDPKLLERTDLQIKAKEMAVSSYRENIKALDTQLVALKENAELRIKQAINNIEQARLKVQSDSIAFVAAKTNYDIAEFQNARIEKLYEEGLRSLTDFEERKLRKQQTEAQKIAAENRFLTSENELLNAKINLNSVRADFQNTIASAESRRFSILSNLYDAEATVTKLQNEYTNYSVRAGMYFITAPQDGYITQAMISGIGETIKEGERIFSIMPADYELAIEVFVKPIDLPLIGIGQNVRMQFDGWPAIVFSGWPNISYGTYGGKVIAIDNFISDNGLYRLLVRQNPNEPPWPDAVRVGAGTDNLLFLRDVPIWYEIWRQLNGFPPDYYKGTNIVTIKEKK
jgi:membrane fusion protein, adhesin transport system